MLFLSNYMFRSSPLTTLFTLLFSDNSHVWRDFSARMPNCPCIQRPYEEGKKARNMASNNDSGEFKDDKARRSFFPGLEDIFNAVICRDLCCYLIRKPCYRSENYAMPSCRVKCDMYRDLQRHRAVLRHDSKLWASLNGNWSTSYCKCYIAIWTTGAYVCM